MDDERKLTELFRSAVRDAPPASFDAGDVAHVSARITRRRRQMLAGGGGVAVVVLVAGLFLGTGGFGHTLSGSSAGVAMAPAQQSDTGGTRLGRGPFAQQTEPGYARTGFPAESPMQGGDSSGRAGPGAGSTSQGCGPADGQLVVALANELPSAGAPAANPADVRCPAGSRSATYAVPGGTVTAVLVRPSETARLRTGTLAFSSVASASGQWQVYLLSSQPGQSAAGLLTLNQRIAARF